MPRLLPVIRHGERKGKAGTSSWLAYDVQPAAVKLDKVACYCQAQAGPFLTIPCRIDFVKALEYPVCLDGVHPNAGVGHFHTHATPLAGSAYRHAPSPRGEFDGVVNEIHQDLLKPASISAYRR